MGTRCMVLVEAPKGTNQDSALLYHHWDGYPTNMVPLLRKLLDLAMEADSYMRDRAGKMAGLVAQTDRPGAYDICPYLDLHWDIEWLYVIDVSEGRPSAYVLKVFTNDGSWGDHPVYSSTGEHENLKLIWEGPLADSDGEEIQELAYPSDPEEDGEEDA